LRRFSRFFCGRPAKCAVDALDIEISLQTYVLWKNFTERCEE